MLGLDGKEQIEKYGLEPFIAHCKERVFGNIRVCGRIFHVLSDFGRIWIILMSHTIIHLLNPSGGHSKKIFDKKLLYKGFKK